MSCIPQLLPNCREQVWRQLEAFLKTTSPGPSRRRAAVAGGCSARLGGSHPTALNSLSLGVCVPEHLGKAGGQRLGMGAVSTQHDRDQQVLSGVMPSVLVPLSRGTRRFWSSCPPAGPELGFSP